MSVNSVSSGNSVGSLQAPNAQNVSVTSLAHPVTNLAEHLKFPESFNLLTKLSNNKPHTVALTDGMDKASGFGKITRFFGNLFHNLETVLFKQRRYNAEVRQALDTISDELKDFTKRQPGLPVRLNGKEDVEALTQAFNRELTALGRLTDIYHPIRKQFTEFRDTVILSLYGALENASDKKSLEALKALEQYGCVKKKLDLIELQNQQRQRQNAIRKSEKTGEPENTVEIKNTGKSEKTGEPKTPTRKSPRYRRWLELPKKIPTKDSPNTPNKSE